MDLDLANGHLKALEKIKNNPGIAAYNLGFWQLFYDALTFFMKLSSIFIRRPARIFLELP